MRVRWWSESSARASDVSRGGSTRTKVTSSGFVVSIVVYVVLMLCSSVNGLFCGVGFGFCV